MDPIAKIASQIWLEREAAKANPRSDARKLTQPINKAKGIDQEIIDNHGARLAPEKNGDHVKPAKNDIRPDDVFAGTPNQMGVLNLALTGEGLEKAIDKKVPKDKGFDVVRNLSQYLIRTDGGGSGDPAGKKLK